jgi:hypothetical protein
VAFTLCSRETALEFARRSWLDMSYPLPAHPDGRPEAQAAEDWFHGRLRDALARFLQQQRVDPAQFAVPPQPETDECRSYCRRCRGQYVLDEGPCSTCGLTLERLAAPTAQEERTTAITAAPVGDGRRLK